MNFEQEYQLKQFREVQDQYFDNDGKCYTGVKLSASIMENMLKLINVLSEREESTEFSEPHETKALHIADVSSSATENRPNGLEDSDWWCPNCEEVVEPHDVTNDERHGIAGCLSKVN